MSTVLLLSCRTQAPKVGEDLPNVSPVVAPPIEDPVVIEATQAITQKQDLTKYDFSMPDEDLCVILLKPEHLKIDEKSNWDIELYHCKTAEAYAFDYDFILKTDFENESHDYFFAKHAMQNKKIYSTEVHFMQPGKWHIQLAYVPSASEETLLFKQKLLVEVAAVHVQKKDETIFFGLPDLLEFEKLKGLKIQLNWPESKVLNKDDYYDIELQLSQALPTGFVLKMTAQMPDMEHKMLDFFVEDVPGDVLKKTALVQLTMFGQWSFKTMILDAFGEVIDQQSFVYQLSSPDV